jgi:hypothetical protein
MGRRMGTDIETQHHTDDPIQDIPTRQRGMEMKETAVSNSHHAYQRQCDDLATEGLLIHGSRCALIQGLNDPHK